MYKKIRNFAFVCSVGVLAVVTIIPSIAARADSPVLGAIIRKDEKTKGFCPNAKLGDVCAMNQYDAEKYCADHGGLPTAKQLAVVLNPSGVNEYPFEGFKTIYRRDGGVDFYYDGRDYQGSSGDEGNYWFWSSTLDPSLSYYAYGFNGRDGEIALHYTRAVYDGGGAVRCVGR